MAKSASKTEPAAEAPAPKTNKRIGKLVLACGLATALLAGGGAAWFFLVRGPDAHAGVKQGPPKPPVFVNMEPFTVNLQPEDGEQYLQVVAVLRVADSEAANALKLYMPEMRHKILLLLSSKKASDVASAHGREKLSEEIRSASNAIVASATGKTVEAEHTATADAGTEQAAAAKSAGEAKPESAGAGAPGTVEGPEPDVAKVNPAVVVAGPVQSVLFTSFIVQ